MVRLLVATCALLLAACGGGNGPAGLVSGPPSAQTVAASDSDWSGLHKCSESGSYDSYLKLEQAKAPDQYQTDMTTWNDLKAAGANDSYIAAYAENTSDCGQFNSGTPTGKVAYVYAIRFKDTTSAAASFKSNTKDFHLDDPTVSQLKAAGATVSQGTSTGLGDNSIVVTIDLGGSAVYVTLWQNKSFMVAMVAFNEGSAAAQAAKNVNGRIS
jgi:hypothetical protein